MGSPQRREALWGKEEHTERNGCRPPCGRRSEAQFVPTMAGRRGRRPLRHSGRNKWGFLQRRQSVPLSMNVGRDDSARQRYHLPVFHNPVGGGVPDAPPSSEQTALHSAARTAGGIRSATFVPPFFMWLRLNGFGLKMRHRRIF